MAIKLMKVGVSAVLGGIDILTEYVDEKKAYTKSFQNITDWGRILYVGGGYIANSQKWVDDDITETAVLAGLPLLEKSIKRAVDEIVLQPMGRKGRMGLRLKTPGRTPRRTSGAPTGNIRIL